MNRAFRFPAAAVAGACLSCVLPAQKGFVSPREFAGVEGSSSTFYPFFRAYLNKAARQSHEQTVHDLGKTPGKIYGIAFRRDGIWGRSTGSPSCWVEVEIACSTAVTTSGTMSRTFASNEGKDRTVVLAKKKIRFNAFPALPGRPQPFSFVFPFDQNRVFGFGGGSLCVDVTVTDNDLYDESTKSYKYVYLDRVFNSTTGLHWDGGHGCFGSAHSIFPFYSHSYSYARFDYLKNQRELSYFAIGGNGRPGGTGLHLMSTALLPRPMELTPVCRLYVDPGKVFRVLPGAAYSSTSTLYYFPPRVGNRSSYLTVPWEKGLRGLKFYTQSINLDPGANSWNLVTGNYSEVTLPMYSERKFPLSYLYATGFMFYNRTGYLATGAGLVTKFLTL